MIAGENIGSLDCSFNNVLMNGLFSRGRWA